MSNIDEPEQNSSQLCENVPVNPAGNRRKPRGAFPPDIILPSWLRWPLNQKFPRLGVNNGAYWSRGPLGNSLYPKRQSNNSRPDFVLVDPSHTKLTYDTLHDPGLSKHFKQLYTKSLLKRNHFIDNNGFVVCSQKEQNQYRAYLHAGGFRDESDFHYKIDMDKHMQNYAEHKLLQNEAHNYPLKLKHWEETLQNGQAIQRRRTLGAMAKYKISQQQWRDRLFKLEEFRQQRNDKIAQKNADAWTKHLNQGTPIVGMKSVVHKASFQQRAKLAEDNKLIAISEKKEHEDARKKLRWENILAGMQFRKEEKEFATEVVHIERQRRIARREERYVEHRRRMPILIQEKKLKEQRRSTLAHQFAMFWLHKIRERLKRMRLDADHVSNFKIDKSLGVSVADLHLFSGDLPLDLKSLLRNMKKSKSKSKDKNKKSRSKSRSKSKGKLSIKG